MDKTVLKQPADQENEKSKKGLKVNRRGNIPPLCDIHAHVLYDMDDGPDTRAAMCRMLDAAEADGVDTLFATSHLLLGRSPFRLSVYKHHLAEAQTYCRGQEYRLKVCSGAEIMYSRHVEKYANERRLPTLGESDSVLMEFEPDVTFDQMQKGVQQVLGNGYQLIIAHIERYNCLYDGNAAQLKSDCPVMYQVNCSTVLDWQGFAVGWEIHQWFKDGLIDYVASDSHDTAKRPTRMRAAYKKLAWRYGKDYATQLMTWQKEPEEGETFSAEI